MQSPSDRSTDDEVCCAREREYDQAAKRNEILVHFNDPDYIMPAAKGHMLYDSIHRKHREY